MKKCRSLDGLLNWLIWLSILTSSFDIVGNIEIGGYSFRLSQMLMMPVMFVFLVSSLKNGLRFSRFLMPLFICLVLNTVFIFNAINKTMAVAYDLWFAFNIAELITISYYLPMTESFEGILRKYIYCFTFMGIIGILQAVLQRAGIYFLIRQVNSMYRTNGFSYEPSFYATYMIMGAVLCMYMFEKTVYIALPKRRLLICTAIIVLAIVLSTSRMGWLTIGLYIVWRILKQKSPNLSKLRLGQIFIYLCFILLGVAVIGAIYLILTENSFIITLLSGSGIAGTSSHSKNGRINGVLNTFKVFLSSPLIGCSLGGTDAAVADLSGIQITSYEIGGYSVCALAEILVAWGIIGGICFIRFLYSIIVSEFRKAAPLLDNTKKEALRGIVEALVFEILMLCLNNNILRIAVWVHMAILCSLYAKAKE